MPASTKNAAAARRASIDLAAVLLIVAGGALLLGGYAYRVFVLPEMPSPEAEAMLLWPFFLAGSIALLAGWLLDRAEG